MVQWDKDSCARRRLPEDRPARPGDALGGRALRRGDRAHPQRAHRPLEDPLRRPGDLRGDPGAPRPTASSRSRAGRRWPRCCARAREPRRPHDPGRDRAPRPDPGRRRQPLHRAPAARCAPTRTYEVPYDHPSLGAAAGDARHDHLPGPGDRGRDGLRRLLRGRGRGAAAGDEPQALGAAMEAHHRRFVGGRDGARTTSRRELAERVWDMVKGFSGFGFPKAHGAAFGLLAYQSTWLRVHYAPGVPVRAAQRAADGLLPARRAGARGAAARPDDAAADVNAQRGRVHGRGRRPVRHRAAAT